MPTDISVTATSVAPVTTGTEQTTIAHGIAGATITAGQLLYLDSAAGTLKLADSDASSSTAVVVGVSLHAASAGQPLAYAIAGTYTAGFVVVVGARYYLSSTAGAITLTDADHTSGTYPCFWGWGVTAALIRIIKSNAGVAVPA